MWDLPGPGLEPVSPALAGGFLTISPPGKPQLIFELNQTSSLLQGAGSSSRRDKLTADSDAPLHHTPQGRLAGADVGMGIAWAPE